MEHTENAAELSEDVLDHLITIRECNSIEEATIRLRRGSLNIKYGPNGIGKSTIARALTLNCEGTEALHALTPFKYQDMADGPRPYVEGADDINQVMTFNDEYVSNFVFQPDEVLKNSFEIFINTEEYRAGEALIENQFESLKRTFADQPEFDQALHGLADLKGAFNLTKSGALAKTSKAYKGIGVGGKLANIPEQLQGYGSFLNSDNPATWITWQAKGKAFLELSDNCPFCSASSVNKAVATKVSEEYDSAAVRNLSALRSAIEQLGQYFSPTDLEVLTGLTTSISLSTEQNSFISKLHTDISTLLNKLSEVKNLSFHALKDEPKIGSILEGLKIDLTYLASLNSEATRSVVELINGKLDEVIGQINEINRQIGVQNTRVKRLISANQNAINAFLTSAGYRYAVRIEPNEGTYRMLLEHQDAEGSHIEAARDHLSYGEKNAFALVLFMHDVQHKQPDLVVLDDPVSSFDKTKKFAILHQLFRGENSLSGTSTLLLTHDIEPAIDIVRTGTARKFMDVKPVVHFLSGRRGKVSEKLVKPEDISTFSEVCKANICAATDPIIKCIYLRRLFEVHGSKDVTYELLSSLLHAREIPDRKLSPAASEPLNDEEVRESTAQIRKYIPGFDYGDVLAHLRDLEALKGRFDETTVGYEKVQIFRIMLALDSSRLKGDEVFTKFVNETYHIENEYVMQLNPRNFDAVPEFVVDACTELVERAIRQ